jgi:hypothetical protein
MGNTSPAGQDGTGSHDNHRLSYWPHQLPADIPGRYRAWVLAGRASSSRGDYQGVENKERGKDSFQDFLLAYANQPGPCHYRLAILDSIRLHDVQRPSGRAGGSFYNRLPGASGNTLCNLATAGWLDSDCESRFRFDLLLFLRPDRISRRTRLLPTSGRCCPDCGLRSSRVFSDSTSQRTPKYPARLTNRFLLSGASLTCASKSPITWMEASLIRGTIYPTSFVPRSTTGAASQRRT